MKAAIQELMDEHTTILRMLAVLRGICENVSKGAKADCAEMESALEFIVTFADYNHHGKEEDILFPAMEKAGFPRDGGPVGVMLMEHTQGREFVGAMRLAVAALKTGAPGAAVDFKRAATGYEQLLTQHIFKENNMLYPMAMSALDETAWETMSAQFAKVESERMGPQKRAEYEKLLTRLEAAYCVANSSR